MSVYLYAPRGLLELNKVNAAMRSAAAALLATGFVALFKTVPPLIFAPGVTRRINRVIASVVDGMI